jgi:glutathione synthase/RimK-type ligase-like ATP-grasp enzyme
LDVLVLASFLDFHSFVVKEALHQRGTGVIQWDLASFGGDRRGTIRFDDGSFPLDLKVGDLELREWPRTVWARRLRFPKPPAGSHDGDHKHIRQENSFFFQSAWWLLSDHAHWVNPYQNRRRAKSKMVQLAVARNEGLAVPETLYSNDPVQIRAFVDSCPGAVIYKPHRISQFEEETGSLLLHTSVFDAQSYSDQALALCTGIFQTRVPKAFELRVHVMGDFVLAVRIDSQQSEIAKEDWRDANFLDLGMSRFDLPDAVAEAVKNTVRGLGLVFGIVDLIVTPDGDFVFLEVNEMGQFLWVERACPDIRLLEHFCNYLEKPVGYAGALEGAPVSYEDIRNDTDARNRFANLRTSTPRPDDDVEWIDVLV